MMLSKADFDELLSKGHNNHPVPNAHAAGDDLPALWGMPVYMMANAMAASMPALAAQRDLWLQLPAKDK